MSPYLIVLASAAEESTAHSEGAGVYPWLIGGVTLAILLGLLLALISFGGGREHS